VNRPLVLHIYKSITLCRQNSGLLRLLLHAVEKTSAIRMADARAAAAPRPLETCDAASGIGLMKPFEL
jgi:hypothetical protein